MSTVTKMLKLVIMTQFTNRPITTVTNGQKHFGESKSAVRLALALLEAKLWAFKVSPLVLVAATFLHNWKVWIML
jgi:hypothetical protein